MEKFLVAVAEAVGAAVVQEAVSRGVTLVLGKRKKKVSSQGQYLERLMKAVRDVEFMLERTTKLPITEVTLLRDRLELKRDFIEASCRLWSRSKKRQSLQGQPEISQAVTHSSTSHGCVTGPAAMFSVSSFIGMTNDDELCLSCDDVDRFEQFAESARNILGRVESACSLRRYMVFKCALVRRLFAARKNLFYLTVQAEQERSLLVLPACLEEERGVEAFVAYWYTDHKRPEKSFTFWFVLRLSESTDIVGVAMNCLRTLASQFNLVAADTAMGELTLLVPNLQDVSEIDGPLPSVSFEEWYSKIIRLNRPDPLCCKAKGLVPPANNVVMSELSHIIPEEVNNFCFMCYISAPDYSLRSSSADQASKRSVIRNRRPPLRLAVVMLPHLVADEQLRASYVAEVIGDNDDEEEEPIDVSIQQATKTVRSRAINCFLRQPKVTEYKLGWVTKHGVVGFGVQKPIAGALKTEYRW